MESAYGRNRHRKWLLLGILALTLGVLPLFLGSYLVTILIFIWLNAIVALGLGLLVGYAGQMSLGHNAFYGLGAYISAILTFRYGISPWLGILIGIISTGTIAYLIGKPILRLRGHMLTIVTCVTGLIFWGLFGEMDFITGGYEGFSRIPRLSIFGFKLASDIRYYYFVLIVLSVLFLIISNIAKSKIGSEFKTIDLGRGGSELAAESIGINIGKIKNQVFVISAIYASIGGSLYVHYITHIDPGAFTLLASFTFVVMVALGGARSLYGPILGAAFYIGLKELITFVLPSANVQDYAGYETIIFTVLFIATLLFLPDGIVGLPALILKRGLRNKRLG